MNHVKTNMLGMCEAKRPDSGRFYLDDKNATYSDRLRLKEDQQVVNWPLVSARQSYDGRPSG